MGLGLGGCGIKGLGPGLDNIQMLIRCQRGTQWVQQGGYRGDMMEGIDGVRVSLMSDRNMLNGEYNP